jgi:hypothetical protein
MHNLHLLCLGHHEQKQLAQSGIGNKIYKYRHDIHAMAVAVAATRSSYTSIAADNVP